RQSTYARAILHQQKKLNRDERIHQLGHLYELKKNITNIPEEVVIIDDIMTTGVTLENCAEVLKRAGVKKVHAVTLFIAD
ncbi:MAG TPA: phosphoribosyltransferase family protein, partial [Treponemataceae bacterium]|nr:phosphoribosyltransferase family protein [Treponemataceae bacterium]